MQVTVDVVVLFWNRLEDTAACIESVLSQKDVQAKLWLVDQGSDKECLKSLRDRFSSESIHILSAGKNLGVPGGRNLGMKAGVAPTIVCLDNDAVFQHPYVLRDAAALFESQSELGAIAFSVHDYSLGGPDRGNWGYPQSVKEYFDRSFPTARFCGAGHAIRRKALARTKGYDERLFFFGEELDLSYQLIAADYKIKYEPRLGVLHKLSLAGRLAWSNGRFYYNVRNMLYLNHKYFRHPLLFLQYSLGYLFKGLRNGQLATALKGIKDALLLIRRSPSTPVISKAAQQYIFEAEFAPRGSTWQRLRKEVLVRMKETKSEC